MATFNFTVYRTLRRVCGPVRAYRIAGKARACLNAAKPLVVVSCGAVVIHATFLSLGGI